MERGMTWEGTTILNQNISHFGLLLGYIIIGIALLAVLVFSAIHILSNIKKAKTAIFAIVGGVGLYLLCFVLARSIPLVTGTGDDIIEMTGEQMKFVEANLYLAYSMLGIAILAIIYSAISNIFK